MKLATLRNDSPDGRMIVVSGDGTRFARTPFPTLQAAIENWADAIPALSGISEFPEELDATKLAAAMPRSWQWLDGSAFSTHGKLMQIAFGLDPIETKKPLMYQGISDRFFGPLEPVPFPSEGDGIDFEGEFGVIVDHVPMGTSADEAMKHIKLIVQINDWSLRVIAPAEMKTGFGWVQAKPACSMAPYAITPDELGEAWKDGRVCLDLEIAVNDKPFGRANGREMDVGFHDLIAHAAYSRDLVAGTIIGSGTVSNAGYAEVGSSCISEVRAIEMIANQGTAETGFLKFGDRVRMTALASDGSAPFGSIDQRIASK